MMLIKLLLWIITKKLLLPVFQSNPHVFLVVTKVIYEDFIAMVTEGRYSNVLAERAGSTSKLIFGDQTKLDVCEFVNSSVPDHRMESVQKAKKIAETEHFRKLDLGAKYENLSEENTNTNKLPNIYLHSVNVRTRILTMISKLESISIMKHKFPLPPVLDQNRKRCLKQAISAVEQMKQTLIAEPIDQIQSVLTDKTNILQELRSNIAFLDLEIEKLEAIQRTPSYYKFGDDIISFASESTIVDFIVPTRFYFIKQVSHSCSYKVTKEVPNTGHVEVTIKPDFFSFTQKEGHSWFIRIWIEYDGKTCNEARIIDLRTQLSASIHKEKLQANEVSQHLQLLLGTEKKKVDRR